jgi:2-polyprenyl-3-methyl-5-hydroxy-6-metoxy-1,4-benzoquinol methylase
MGLIEGMRDLSNDLPPTKSDDPRRSDRLYGREVRLIAPARVLAVAPCQVCEGTEARALFEVDGINSPVVACSDCGLGYYHPMLEPRQVLSFYPSEYYGEPGAKFRPSIERLVRFVGRRHIRFLSRHLPKGARVLDVGCGRGVLLGPLADLGFDVHGLEVSEDAVQGVDLRAKIRVAWDLAEARYSEAYFDEVILWHVLEHLRQPRATIKECFRVLRPGGRIVVSVPNFASLQARWSGAAWFHLDAPRHLYHFPVSALRRLLVDTGFEVRSEHHFSLRQNPFSWIQSAMNRYSRMPRNALYAHLYRSRVEDRPQLDAATRLTMWTVFFLGSPLALALSVGATILRSGASIHIVATKKT